MRRLGLVLLFWSAAGSVAAAPLYDFNIPAQPIDRALVALTVQVNGSLGGDYQSCSGRSVPFHRRASLKTALETLLAPSGCRFRIADDNAIVILKPQTVAQGRRTTPKVSASLPAGTQTVVVTARPLGDVFLAGIGTRRTVDADQMRLAGVVSLTDIAPLVPGMVATNLGPGRNKILLRGMSDGVFPGEAISTVAIILDNSPLNYSEKDPSLRLVDVADVAVAPAPQGLVTSAIGGVVRIRSNPPDLEQASAAISGALQSTHYGGAGHAVDLVANVPLFSGTAAVRGVLYEAGEAGYIRDILPTRESRNSSRETGGRLSYRQLIDGHWTFTAAAIWQRLSVADSQYVFDTTRDFSRTNRIAEPNSNKANYVYTTLAGTLGVARVSWTETYSDHSLAERYDATQSLGIFGQSTTNPAAYDSRKHVQTLISDLSASMPALGGQWRSGVLMVNERDTAVAALGLVSAPSAPLYEDARRDRRIDLSAFVEARYALARKLSVELGATAYQLDQDIRSNAVNTFGAVVGKPFTTEVVERGVKPAIALIYTPSDDWTLSARVSTGARPAGVNTGVLLARRGAGVTPYQANRTYVGDRVTEYELNQKYTTRTPYLAISLSEFIVEWRRVQADEFSIYNTPITVNVGDGELTGVEADVVLKPMEGLEIHAIGSGENTSLGGKVTKAYFSGTYGGLIGVPKYSAGLSVIKSVELAPFALTGSVEYHALGPSRATFDGLTASSVRGYQILDASAEIRHDHLSLLFICSNLADSKGDTLAFGNPFSIQRGREITPVRPRTISLKLSLTF